MTDAWHAAQDPGLVADLLRPVRLARDVEGGLLGGILERASWPELRYPMLAAWTEQWSRDDDEPHDALPLVHARTPTTTLTTQIEVPRVVVRRTADNPRSATPTVRAAKLAPPAHSTSPTSVQHASRSDAAPPRVREARPAHADESAEITVRTPPAPREATSRTVSELPRVVSAFRQRMSESTGDTAVPIRRDPVVTPVAAPIGRSPVVTPTPPIASPPIVPGEPAVPRIATASADPPLVHPAPREPASAARERLTAPDEPAASERPPVRATPRSTTSPAHDAPPLVHTDTPPSRAASRSSVVHATEHTDDPARPAPHAAPRIRVVPPPERATVLARPAPLPARPRPADPHPAPAVAARWSDAREPAAPHRFTAPATRAATLTHTAAAAPAGDPRRPASSAPSPVLEAIRSAPASSPVPSTSPAIPTTAPTPPAPPPLDVAAVVATVERRLARELGRARELRRSMRSSRP